MAELRGTPGLARGELMRWFAEAAWYPTALLPSQGVRWDAVDDRSAYATVTDGDTCVRLLFGFQDDGTIGTVRSEARERVVDGAVTTAPWEGRFLNYALRDGMRVPLDAEVAWILAEGPHGYFRATITGRDVMEKVLACVVEANTAQMRDPAFVEELKRWIRFGEDEALRTGDGLFSTTSGNPVVPRWLGSLLFGMFFTEQSENDKYARHIRSSAGIAVFVSDADDRAHWIEAGRRYERFALQATALGIRNAMLNQPVEVPAMRLRFVDALGIVGGRPDLVVRFGRGPAMPRSLRRPVSAVLL